MLSTLILLTTIYLCASTSISHNRVIHVHRKGHDNQQCLHEQTQHCRTIEFIARELRNDTGNVTIILESQIYIQNGVTFENFEYFAIQGGGEMVSLKCNCRKRGADLSLSFVHITNLQLSQFTILLCCGVDNAYGAAIFSHKCSNINVENVRFNTNVHSTALTLINPHGEINIKNCKFSNNGHKRLLNTTSFTGGLFVQSSQNTMVTTITIENCEFISNKSPFISMLDPTMKKEKCYGGGMGIELLNYTKFVTFDIINSTFTKNSAEWGGGLYIYTQQLTSNNTIIVSNTSFQGNKATKGGGGLYIKLDKDFENHILFRNVSFEGNSAEFGGGTSISALTMHHIAKLGGTLQFINCTWYENFGYYSPAVDISPYRSQQSSQDYTIIPLFKDIYVRKNYIKTMSQKYHFRRINLGVFIITCFSVCFQGNILFEDNWHSAMYLVSGRAVFNANSSAIFDHNQGILGGAIAMHSFSSLVVKDNTYFVFVNNSATRTGGGIYYAPSDQREYFSAHGCFLEYGGEENNVTRRNITFKFVNNKATLGGPSIYSESFISCYYTFFEKVADKKKNITKFFDKIGNFYFDSTANPLATASRSVDFRASSSAAMETLPGKLISLPLVMYDEFETTVHSEFGLRIEGNEMVQLDNHFTINSKARVYGAPKQNATLVMSTPQVLYSIDYYIPVTLLPCTPGFYYDQDMKKCLCSSDNDLHSYPAIVKCDHVNFTIFLKRGYWLGYYPSHSNREDDLYTAFYPSIFNNSDTGLLGITTNNDGLPNLMCGSSREGVLCGTCKTGYSAYYHSTKITCGKNRLCRLGTFFYILSEIIPTLIFFTIVTTLGISFSSGAMNGFVFFSQVVDVFSQDLIFSQSHNEATVINVLRAGHQLIYGIFNIDYFSFSPFCLWEGATVLDALAFKYITTIFVILFVTIITVLMNYSSLKRCSWMHKLKAKGWRRDSSVTHGISTFLIICYGQYTRVSFFILTKTYLQGKSGVNSIPVTYYGGLPYLSDRHLLYAIPAIVCTTFLVVLPPFLLLLYPLILHLLSTCGLSEHPLMNKMLYLLRINRLLPLFDSFQSCYRDKMRFFAGLYFLYRAAAFLAYMYSETLPPALLAVLILGIHSVLQPYKSWKHNVIDGLIFLDIAIINIITEMIKTSLIAETNSNIHQLKLVQLAFIYIPIISLLSVILFKIGIKFCFLWKSHEQKDSHAGEASRAPNLMIVRELTFPTSELQAPLMHEH